MVIEAWLTATLGSVWKWKGELRHEADLMEQTDDNVRLVEITFWSKPGQACRLAPIAAGVIMVVCVLRQLHWRRMALHGNPARGP